MSAKLSAGEAFIVNLLVTFITIALLTWGLFFILPWFGLALSYWQCLGILYFIKILSAICSGGRS